MAAILESFGLVWHRTSLVQRVLLVGIVLGVIFAGGGLAYWATRPELSLLYSGLAPQEAAKIVEKARDSGIAYALKDGGTTIYVATNKVYDLRLKMASEGLPSSNHEGYALLDKTRLGDSPTMQDAILNHALEGELAKTIEALDLVVTARVSIVAAGDTLFGRRENQATASVTLKLRGGARMTGRNVEAVQYLVARAVRGLDPTRVAIIDTGGNKLSSEDEDEYGGGAKGALDHKIQTENYYVRKIENLLVMPLGRDNFTVQVAATIDNKSIEEFSETPTMGIEVRSTTKTVSSKPVAGSTVAAGAMETKDTMTESDTPAGRTVIKTVSMAGGISDLSVSVFVDLAAAGGNSEADGGNTTTPAAGDIDVAKIKLMVTNALTETGITPKIEVTDVPFRRMSADEIAAASSSGEDAGMFTREFILDIAKRGSLGMVVLGALFALKIITKKSKNSVLNVEGEAGAQSSNLLTAGAGGREALKSQITKALQDNPEEVRRLFLSWAEQGKRES